MNLYAPTWQPSSAPSGPFVSPPPSPPGDFQPPPPAGPPPGPLPGAMISGLHTSGGDSLRGGMGGMTLQDTMRQQQLMGGGGMGGGGSMGGMGGMGGLGGSSVTLMSQQMQQAGLQGFGRQQPLPGMPPAAMGHGMGGGQGGPSAGMGPMAMGMAPHLAQGQMGGQLGGIASSGTMGGVVGGAMGTSMGGLQMQQQQLQQQQQQQQVQAQMQVQMQQQQLQQQVQAQHIQAQQMQLQVQAQHQAQAQHMQAQMVAHHAGVVGGPLGGPMVMSAPISEAEAWAREVDGQLLMGLLCAALYPQVIAIEREETKKKKGINAPMKLRIRDKHDKSQVDQNGEPVAAPEPTEVAIHPSSVNAKETRFTHAYLIYHEKVKTTRVYVRDCSPVSAYALILFGGVLSSQPGAPVMPPPLPKKHKKHWQPPPPPPPRDGVLVIDGWIKFSVSVQEQQLLIGVRSKLDALLASKIESPDMEFAEVGKELLSAVSQVLNSN